MDGGMAMNGEPEALVEYLPQVRCTAALKRRLERVAQRSVTRNLADHIRFAVEMYVAEEEGRQEVFHGGAPDGNPGPAERSRTGRINPRRRTGCPGRR